MILIIDNYDSFTYNAAQALGSLGAEIRVVRNDTISEADALAMNPSHLVISPGPGRPEQAGISGRLIQAFGARIPVLGICLGHQCIASEFGGTIRSAKSLVHGKTSSVWHDGSGLYSGVPSPLSATRYHSLSVAEADLPDCLEVSALTADGEIMGLRHRELRMEGVQFHPESVLTDRGDKIFQNFLNMEDQR